MSQDTTPAIVIYQGDGSNNVFSVPFDKGYYGEIKVAFVRRGLTDYEYEPDNYVVSGRLYAWANGALTYYTHTPTPAIGASIYDENDIDTGYTVASTAGSTINVNGRSYARSQQKDLANNLLLTWSGDTLNVGDYICIVRETERGQPYEMPANQKHIEYALDNIERQVQELKSLTDNALIVDPTYQVSQEALSPIAWMETIIRCTDLSARELRYFNGWLQYSLDDPKSAAEDKEWYNVINTDNIKNIYYKIEQEEKTGRELYNVYYIDKEGVTHLFTYDAQAQRDDIEALKIQTAKNTDDIENEKAARRAADDELRRMILEATFDVSQFDGRITKNEGDIAALEKRFHSSVTENDPAMPRSYIDDKVAGMYHIKGVVDTVEDLPSEGNQPGDCWNVLSDAHTYLWTATGEWVSMGETIDFSPYRTADEQDVIDAGKQGKLTAGDYINITANDVISMTGKFGTTFSMSGKNLVLRDQDNNKLSETMIAIGVDADYTPEEEDIKFDEGETGDYTFLQEQITAINKKIPDAASELNKLVANSQVGRADLTIQKNGTDLGTFNANASESQTINVTVPVDADDVHALPDTTKYAANMSLSINSNTYVITAQLKDQEGNNIGSAQTVDLPLETVVVSGEYDSENKKIVLTLKDGSTIDIPVGDLIAGLQTEITDANKLSADLVDDTTATHKFVTTQDKTNWDNKVTKTTAGSKVYGTDNAGAQTTYDVNSFGQVDDVKVNNVSVVTNKIANVTVPTKVSDLTNDAGYTTNVGTVTSVNNVQPDANGNVTIQTGGGSISALSDVELTTLSDGDALVYDADSGKWVNGTGGVSASYDATTKTITFA